MANANRACDLDESALSGVIIFFFGMIRGQTSVCDLARNKDVFAIMPTGFGNLIFQLFPRLAKDALTLENSTIIVVSPLISIRRDQVEH